MICCPWKVGKVTVCIQRSLAAMVPHCNPPCALPGAPPRGASAPHAAPIGPPRCPRLGCQNSARPGAAPGNAFAPASAKAPTMDGRRESRTAREKAHGRICAPLRCAAQAAPCLPVCWLGLSAGMQRRPVAPFPSPLPAFLALSAAKSRKQQQAASFILLPPLPLPAAGADRSDQLSRQIHAHWSRATPATKSESPRSARFGWIRHCIAAATASRRRSVLGQRKHG